MNRIKMLKYINPIIAVLVVNQLLSAIFSGMLHPETFEVLHKGGGVLLFIGVFVHVVLNWGWVKSTYLRK
jgi:hypothetical protein